MDEELQQAEKVAAEHGHAVSEPCEKCMDYVYEKPVYLGGSMSFEELKVYREAQKVEGVYYTATLDYRDLSANILNDDELSIEEKATKLIGLTQEFQKVVTNVDDYYEDFKDRKQAEVKPLVKKSPLQMVKRLFSKGKELTLEGSSGFKIFETSQGLRWLSYSSNAFEDLEGELFTTKALEEAVESADATGERGPLRIFHVPNADVGDADFQAVAGRFLIESGTFRSDELGQKAVEYFKANADKDFQVSIGYSYKEGDEWDGVYDWVRIFERSVCPFGDAANPFTSFALSSEGGKEMDERKMRMLKDIFGDDLASKIVGKAESETKELEQSVAFKTTELLAEVKAVMESMPEGEAKTKMASVLEKHEKSSDEKAEDKKDEKADGEDEGKEDAKTDAKSDSKDEKEVKEDEKDSSLEIKADFAPIAVALEAFTEKLGGIESLVTSLQSEVKEIKEKEANAPRAKSLFRATEDEANSLDPAKVKELVGSDEDPPVNHARPYVEDVLNSIPSRS